MGIAARIGTSLLAMIVAAPAVSASVTPAEAQSLVDRLFRNPARQKRALRERSVRRLGTRTTRRQVRRQRTATRRATKRTVRQAATRRASAPRRTASRSQRGNAPVAVIKAPTFYDYAAEPLVRIAMSGVALRVAEEMAQERAQLEANPIIRPVEPGGSAARTTEQKPMAHLTAKALLKPSGVAETSDDGEASGDAVAVSLADEPPANDALSVREEVNRTASLAAEPFDVLDTAPVFEVVRDPRADALRRQEALWRAFGLAEATATEPVAQAVVTHYEDERDLLWTDGERVRPAARQIVRVLREAASYGLDPNEYRVPAIPGRDASLTTHMAFELALTVAALQYVKDASVGRVIADRLSGYHDLPRRTPDLLEVIDELAEAASPADVLLDAHPDTTEFARLRDELAALRGAALDPVPTLPAGPSMRAGQPDERTPILVDILRRVASEKALREHADALAAYDGGELLPEALDGFVRAVQTEKGLRADGIVGPRTAAKLVVESPQSKIERIELAMERSRWLPHEFAGRSGEYVMINAAAYRVQHVKDGEVDLSMRVVVGKPGNQTNFFYDEIEHIEFNPDWAVPRSIVVNEYLPKLRSNPGYLDRLGYEVRDARGRLVNSSSVNWGQYGADVPFSVRQPSSSSGALGELKIEFPNRHAIYMHDTPAKNLFSRETRAYSHGCVRLAEPRRMAAAMLGTTEADVATRIQTGGHHNAPVDRHIPVYVSYFTAWPTDTGEIGFYADVYGRDKALLKALARTDEARTGEAESWQRIPVPVMRARPKVYTLSDEVEELAARKQFEADLAPVAENGVPLPTLRPSNGDASGGTDAA